MIQLNLLKKRNTRKKKVKRNLKKKEKKLINKK